MGVRVFAHGRYFVWEWNHSMRNPMLPRPIDDGLYLFHHSVSLVEAHEIVRGTLGYRISNEGVIFTRMPNKFFE